MGALESQGYRAIGTIITRMVNRLVAQLLFIGTLAFLVACSSHPSSTNSNTANPISAPSNGSSLTPASRGPSKLVGLVVTVTDGDTIDVLDEQHASSRIRLKGIDAPEKRQAFGNVARQNLVDLVAGKAVLVEWQKLDQYGRIIGKVSYDNRDICLEQIRAGLAWHYKEFENEQSEVDRLLYAEAEREARSQKLGLWRDASQIQPWEFRHHKPATTGNYESPKQSSSPTPTTETEGSIRGNKNSKIYHWPGCPNYDDIALHNRVTFRTSEEAERAGYRAAKNCP